MSDTVRPRTTCRLCGEKDLDLAVHFVPTPVGDAFIPASQLDQVQQTYALDVMLCQKCGNTQLHNVVDPEIIYREYYYKSSVSLGLVEHFSKYAATVLDKVKPKSDALIVEIGSNEGAMLRPFKERGFGVLGVDPAIAIAERATEAGIETMPTYFTATLARDIKKDRGAASIIIANNVFANIDDLTDVIEGVQELLDEDGVFIFETSYWLDVVDKLLIDTVFHEHLTYFAVKPSKSFFEKRGMQLIDVEHVSTKGGSIRTIVQRAGGKRPVSSSVANQIDQETKAGLYNPETYKAMNERLQRLTADLVGELKKLKSQGKIIAAYGAAVGLTTMIYHFGIGEYLDFIADDNTDKQNTFSPGLHIPTLASSAIYERKADVVLVLAWRYADTIMKNHQAFHDNGGRYIIPLPEIKIV